MASFNCRIHSVLRLTATKGLSIGLMTSLSMGMVSKPFDWHNKGSFDLALCQSPSIGIWTKAIRRTPSRPFEGGHQEGNRKICPGQILALFGHNSTRAESTREFSSKGHEVEAKGGPIEGVLVLKLARFYSEPLRRSRF